jgi:hypothetical protein
VDNMRIFLSVSALAKSIIPVLSETEINAVLTGASGVNVIIIVRVGLGYYVVFGYYQGIKAQYCP